MGRLSSDTLPLIKNIHSLNELSLFFKYSKEPCLKIQEIYSHLASFNITKLNLLTVNPIDFLSDNIFSSLRNNFSLKCLLINFVSNKFINENTFKAVYE